MTFSGSCPSNTAKQRTKREPYALVGLVFVAFRTPGATYPVHHTDPEAFVRDVTKNLHGYGAEDGRSLELLGKGRCHALVHPYFKPELGASFQLWLIAPRGRQGRSSGDDSR